MKMYSLLLMVVVKLCQLYLVVTDSLEKNKKIIYTSIKSLSNQKLFELKQKFPDMSILTGDIKFNPDAQCVIMTTEILRNILYQKESQHINISELDKVMLMKYIILMI